MSLSQSFDEFVAGLEAKEASAVQKLLDRYSRQLIAKARARLQTRLRQKVDPEDVVQSVYRSFFRRIDQQEFSLENWQGLWGLLLLMTMRKCGRYAEYFHADKRDVKRELTDRVGDGELALPLAGHEPTPEEVATLTELVEQIMQPLTARQREILELCLQGSTQKEVSEELGCSERTVQRAVYTARQTFESIEAAAGLSQDI